MRTYLETTVDKFTFRVATDRLYNAAGVWAKADGQQITLGVSDFFQQHSGDVAFAEVLPAGTPLAPGDSFATIETIKVDIDLPSPVTGRVVAANEALEMEAEVINQDPYGAGWLAVVEATAWAQEQANLMTPEAYFRHMQAETLAETGESS